PTIVIGNEGKPEKVNALIVRGVDPNLAEIKRSRIQITGALPSVTGVLRPKNSAAFAVNVDEIVHPTFIALDHRHHDSGIRRRNREPNFSRQYGQAIAAFFPTATAICALENPAHVFAVCCGGTVNEAPRSPASSIKRRVNYFRVV